MDPNLAIETNHSINIAIFANVEHFNKGGGHLVAADASDTYKRVRG